MRPVTISEISEIDPISTRAFMQKQININTELQWKREIF